MTVQGVSCLFCRRGLEITEEPKTNKRRARILSLVHKRLCSALKLDFPKEFRKWNFSKEPFPFCLSCQKIILRLIRLMNQLKALEQEISRCVSTLSMLTIASKVSSVVSRLITAQDDVSSCKKGNRKLLEEKHQYFRDVIIQRFNARVMIKQSDQCRDLMKTKTASLNADAKPNPAEEVSSEYPHVVVAADNNYEHFQDDICLDLSPISPDPGSLPGNDLSWDSCPSPIEKDHGQEPSSSDTSETPAPLLDSNTPKTIAASESVPITADCDDSEISENSVLKNPSITKDNIELAERAKAVSVAQEPRQQQFAPLGEILEACELDIKIEPLADPSDHSAQTIAPRKMDQRACASAMKNQSGTRRRGQKLQRFIHKRHAKQHPSSYFKLETDQSCEETEVPGADASQNDDELEIKPSLVAVDGPVFKPLESSVIRVHAGFKISVLKEKARCLTCGLEFESSAKESTMILVRKHITKEHVRRTPALSNNTWNKVEVVDKERKTFRVLRYEFQELENTYECSTCKKVFGFAPRLKWKYIKTHILAVHAQNKDPRRCEICSAEVKNLSQHMKGVHCGESDKEVCEFCGKEFKSLKHLTAHRSDFHRQRERKFQCQDCGKKYLRKQDMERHQWVHGEEKPYICEICGKQFKFKRVLKTHLGCAHGERKFACDQCDRKYGVEFLLTRHVKLVHDRIKPPPFKKKRKKVQEPRDESEEESSESESDTTSTEELLVPTY